ncbi:MAG TPA: carboxypeptidase regulatory-like domain-containing protein [Gemmatimonadaceae bacterium]|nr:carboxypeptidase regulatory-like domain-containing protein [Gemmatimonadaceae bacterium]
MKQATPTASHAVRVLLAAALALAIVAPCRVARAQASPPAAPGFSALQGFIIDSIHNEPLAHASVMIEGTSRSALTDDGGHYRIDSIPPGKHRVSVLHPLLDTLGLVMRTPEYPFGANESHDLDVPIPSAEHLAAAICSNDPMRMRGPGAMVGFVRDPDSKAPATGSSVELVYYEADVIGRKMMRQRKAPVDSAGMYRLCGLPKDMSGKVQVFRNGVSSGEVPAEATGGFVTLRAFSVASTQRVVEMKNDSGKVKRFAKGTARVTGKVLDTKGQPLRDARIALQGGGVVALSKANGTFELDSLPSGTQALEVRKLGYTVTEVPVELAANTTANTTVKMPDAVPLLETMRVEAQADQALSQLGYLGRKNTGMGSFLDGKQINHEALMFSDVLRAAPGLRISPTGDGRTQVVTDARNSASGCVNYRVDGQPWTTMEPGDIDSFVQPADVVAVEIYHGSETPPEYQTPGQSSCATIVVWTRAKTETLLKKKK